MNQHDKSKLEGYTDQLSVQPGDEIGFHISTNAETFSMEIARVGAEQQVVWRREGLRGQEYPVPEDVSSHGCRWPALFKMEVPQWQSGYYTVLMRSAGQHGEDPENQPVVGEMFFVVRSARPGTDTRILLQLTTNTSNAYNTWGGASLYRGPDGPGQRVSFDRPSAGLDGVAGLRLFNMDATFHTELDHGSYSPAFQAEFQRQVDANAVPGIALTMTGHVEVEEPGRRWRLEDLGGSGPPIYRIRRVGDHLEVYDGTPWWENGWRNWQHLFVSWAERNGYRLDYAVNSDLEFHPEILEHYRLVLSVGHDEYWSAPMRDHLEAYVADGGNVAFFSGNCLWWQVRSEDEGRALVCWKDAYEQDPLYKTEDHSLLSTYWCHRLIGRPENYLTGVSFAYGGYSRFFDQFVDSPGGYTIHRPDHWIFEGTGLQKDEMLGATDGVIGYECDGCDMQWHDGLPFPTGNDGTPDGFCILATAPAGLSEADTSNERVAEALYGDPTQFNRHPYPGAAVLGCYTRGGTVVTSGCTQWAKGLQGNDPLVERITKNVLDRLGGPDVG